MKKGERGKRAGKALRGTAAMTTDFTRGFIATGLLSVLQDRGIHPARGLDARRALRHALQGGAALAAGSAAASAVQRRDYALALGALVVGAAAVYGIEQYLRPQAHGEDGEV